MTLQQSLKERIFPWLQQYDFRISAASVRYGSVSYIAFGQATEKHYGRFSTTHYSADLQFGADVWELLEGSNVLLDSCFEDITAARELIEARLVGLRVTDIDMLEDHSSVYFDNGLIWRSEISPEPASGFLYTFDVDNGPCWETVDGHSICED